MFPQHTLIISILTWLWTGPATLTAFDALLLFFSVSQFLLPLDSETVSFFILSLFFSFFFCFELNFVLRLPGLCARSGGGNI